MSESSIFILKFLVSVTVFTLLTVTAIASFQSKMQIKHIKEEFEIQQLRNELGLKPCMRGI